MLPVSMYYMYMIDIHVYTIMSVYVWVCVYVHVCFTGGELAGHKRSLTHRPPQFTRLGIQVSGN